MAAPTTTKYNAEYFTIETLAQLSNLRGIARYAHWGYKQTGVPIGTAQNITVPGIITASQNPMASSQQILPTSRQLTANAYAIARMHASDFQAALAGGSAGLINDHVLPAATAVLEQLDSYFIPYFSYATSRISPSRTDALKTFMGIRMALRKNNVPQNEPIAFIMDLEEEAAVLSTQTYVTPTQTGGASTTMLQTGELTSLLGVNPVPVNNAYAVISPGTISLGATPYVGVTGAAGAAGATMITVSGLTAGLTIKQGDVFSIGGMPFRFVATGAPVTTAASTMISFFPPLPAAVLPGVAVKFDPLPAAFRFDPYYATIAFTPKAFGIIPCELPIEGNDLGIQQFSLTDDVTNLTIRSTISYKEEMTGYGAKQVKLDGLYAVGPVDPARMVLLCRKNLTDNIMV